MQKVWIAQESVRINISIGIGINNVLDSCFSNVMHISKEHQCIDVNKVIGSRVTPTILLL